MVRDAFLAPRFGRKVSQKKKFGGKMVQPKWNLERQKAVDILVIEKIVEILENLIYLFRDS